MVAPHYHTQARAAAATKFIIFSRPRSASTTFVSALNSHPNVSCGYEVFAQHNFAADGLREVRVLVVHAAGGRQCVNSA